MRYGVVAVTAGVLSLILVLATNIRLRPCEHPQPFGDHTYATTTPLEFDKCCTMWLIRRFVDPDATFKIHPQGTYLTGPRVFDVAGATWSRQHRKCTSDCIWEDVDVNDPAAQQIVQMAHQVELNAWRLDEFPQAQQAERELRQIIEQTPDPNDCVKRTLEYFDTLYAELRGN